MVPAMHRMARPHTRKFPRAELASLQLGRSVFDVIAEYRADDVSYRDIARLLRDATDGATDVSGESVRAWHLYAQGDGEVVA